ncbi:MAG TPA: sugar ABC transporter permease [Acetobacteraceae bacterium]|nr:sugar ABC transporter permease [Acetobacteraceae bacterium]
MSTALSVPRGAARPRARVGTPFRSQARTGLIMVTPAAAFFAVFFIYPVVNAVWVSLTSWDLIGPQKFIGIRNYVRLLGDDDFLHAAWVTVAYSGSFLIVTLPLALGLAVALDRPMQARGVYQAIIFAPVVLSMVVVAMIWRAVYSPVGGLYLMFTAPFGLTNIQWLNREDLALPALVVVSIWKNVGYYLVIFLAGLQSIPASFYEAARIDGAAPSRVFRSITLPLLKPYILFALVIGIIRTSQTFSAVYALTEGGPNDATTVLPFLIYQNAFQFNRMGYASAMAIVMFAALLVLTVIQFRLLRSEAGE